MTERLCYSVPEAAIAAGYTEPCSTLLPTPLLLPPNVRVPKARIDACSSAVTTPPMAFGDDMEIRQLDPGRRNARGDPFFHITEVRPAGQRIGDEKALAQALRGE